MTAEYKRQTEQTHKIDLASSITRLHWLKKEAPVNHEVKFELETDKVADNTVVTFEIKDVSGNVNETITEKVRKNKYEGRFKIPEEAEDKLTITAKIEEYGLEAKSKDLLVLQNFTINLVDEYKNEIDELKTFDQLSYLIITDTGKQYNGKVENRAINARNIHFAKELKLQLLVSDPTEEIDKSIKYLDSKETSSTTARQNFNNGSGSSSKNTNHANTGETDADFYDFINFVRTTYNNLKSPVSTTIDLMQNFTK